MGDRPARLERDGLTTCGNGLVQLSPRLQGNAKVAVCFGIPRPQGDGRAEGGNGFIEFSPCFQRDTQVSVGVGKVRLERDRLPVCGDRRRELLLFEKHITEVAPGFGIGGPGGNRTPDQIRRDVMAAHLKGDQPQIVQCIGMARLAGQDLSIELLGLRQPSGLMVLPGGLKGLIDGEWGHIRDILLDLSPRPIFPNVI